MVLQQSDYLYSLRVLDTKKIKRKKPLLACIAIALIGAVIGPSTAHAYDPVESYKLYAHMKLLDDKAYRCLVKLWTLESHWNPKAANPKSSAYGIPQLLKMKERNPYKQIDLGLKYITHRYVNPCLALAHHKRVGHY